MSVHVASEVSVTEQSPILPGSTAPLYFVPSLRLMEMELMPSDSTMPLKTSSEAVKVRVPPFEPAVPRPASFPEQLMSTPPLKLRTVFVRLISAFVFVT